MNVSKMSHDDGAGLLFENSNLKSYRIKRSLDLFGACLLLLCLGPIPILFALAIRLDSPGPSIYKQKRIGLFGKTFVIYKFRTMKVGAPVLSTEEMQRSRFVPLTRVGRLLRKTSLDELPQLFNIVKGEMSFVGPRPALPSQADVNTLREAKGIHSVRPGITGLAQVMGRDDLDTNTKVCYDADYCRRMSLLFDLKLVFRTVTAIITSRGNK